MEKNPSELLKTYANESKIHCIRYFFDSKTASENCSKFPSIDVYQNAT